MKRYFITVCIFSIFVSAAPIDNYLQTLELEVKKENPNFSGFSKVRGKNIFTSKHIGKRAKKISCVSCHTNNLQAFGENVFTGKKIKPLSPKANPKRFTKIKKVKKWLRRNFKDVYNREGTAQEKGDVLVYILSK